MVMELIKGVHWCIVCDNINNSIIYGLILIFTPLIKGRGHFKPIIGYVWIYLIKMFTYVFNEDSVYDPINTETKTGHYTPGLHFSLGSLLGHEQWGSMGKGSISSGGVQLSSKPAVLSLKSTHLPIHQFTSMEVAFVTGSSSSLMNWNLIHTESILLAKCNILYYVNIIS